MGIEVKINCYKTVYLILNSYKNFVDKKQIQIINTFL